MKKNKFYVGENVLVKTSGYYELATITSINLQDNEIRYGLKDVCVISCSGYIGFSEDKILKISDNIDIANKINKINKIKKSYDKKRKKYYKSIEKSIEKLKKQELKEINLLITIK